MKHKLLLWVGGIVALGAVLVVVRDWSPATPIRLEEQGGQEERAAMARVPNPAVGPSFVDRESASEPTLPPSSVEGSLRNTDPSWKKLVDNCPKDPKFGFPLEEKPFLHKMLANHIWGDSFSLNFRSLATAANPRSVALTPEQERQLTELLAPHMEAHKLLCSQFLSSLDSAYHDAVDAGLYIVIEAIDPSSRKGSAPTLAEARAKGIPSPLDEARAGLVSKYGPVGKDLFIMGSSLVRPGLQADSALIYLSRNRWPSTFMLYDEMLKTEASTVEAAARFYAGL